MHIVIFAGGTVRPGQALYEALASADLVIAADSGAVTAARYGYPPTYIVGDFDSLQLPAQQLQAWGSQLVRAEIEKDETDTELALQLALERGASHITLLGALGGARFDHTVANLFLLTSIESVPVVLVDGPARCWIVRGPGRTPIEGANGDLLSLFPMMGDANGVRTAGLYYPLRGETLRFGRPRGVSNVLTQANAEVALEHGMLLVIHTDVSELDESHDG
jgi:thiamine pyrophosphokinase